MLDTSKWYFRWKKAKSVDEFAESIVNPQGFNAVELSDVLVEKTDYEVLSAALFDASVEAISFVRNHLEDSGAEVVMNSLQDDRDVKNLYLQDNFISTAGAQHIADFLRHNTYLKYLDLQGNLIDDKGAAMIREALLANHVLKGISLTYNNIDKEETALHEVLQVHPSLTYMGLLYTNMDDQQKIQKREYRNVILHGDKGKWMRAKLMIVGQGRAGKTATVRSLLGKAFDSSLDSTIGASLSQTETTADGRSGWHEREGGTGSELFITKLAIERTKKLRTGVNYGSIFMAAVTAIGAAATTLLSEQGTGEGRVKSQKKEAVLTREQEEERVKRYNSKLFTKAKSDLRSPKEAVTFSIWDYGGQKVFYTLHHLFLTRFGVYLLVFDMRDVFSKKGDQWQEYLRFWLNSVRLHAPSAPILLVGTFYDKIRRSSRGTPLKSIDQSLEEALHLSKRREQQKLVYNDADSLNFFPLDNRARGPEQFGIVNIRDTIDETTRTQPFVHEEISSHWVSTIDVLTGRGVPYMKLEEVSKIADEVNMTSKEVDGMLRLFHELGVIIYLTSTERLRESVVIDPQWLIDKFSRVIWDRSLHLKAKHPKGFDLDDLSSVGLLKDFNRLKDYGLSSKDLLGYLWKDEKVEFLIDFMKESFLISEWAFSGEVEFLVPSMLQGKSLRPPKARFTCAVDFSESFLPIGVFQRIVCVLVAASGQAKNAKEPSLSEGSAVIWLNADLAIHVEEQSQLDRLVVSVIEPEGAPVALSAIQSALNKLNNSMNRVLRWDVLLGDKDDFVPFSEAKEMKLAPWFSSGEQASVNVDKFLEL